MQRTQIMHSNGRTQCRELPLCMGSGEGCQWQALPSLVQCEETATRTRDLPVIGANISYSFPTETWLPWTQRKGIASCKLTGWAISSGPSARWWPSRPWGTSCWWIYPCSQAEPSFCPCQSWGPGKKWILGQLHFHKLKSSRIMRNNQSDSWVHYLRPHLPHVLEHHVTVAIKSTNPTK